MKTNIWPKKKISWLFDVIGSGTTPSASKEIYYSSPDMAWLNTGDLTDSYVERTTKYVSKQALKDFSALTVFPKESLVMAMYGATIGKLGITKYETTTNQACCVLGQPKGITTKFTFYWLMGHRSEIINLSQGGGQPNISQGIIRNIRIAVPPLELQNKIVAFIDKKFDETNLLINKKEQMIKLLEQQRQSIITEAVTKGLNPNVKMKESGVEWIGEIPEHWEASKLKNMFILQRGHDLTHEQFNKGIVPVYASNGIMGYHDLITTKGPNVTVGRSGSVGKVNYVECDFWAHNTCIYVKDSKKNNMKYIYYILKSLDMGNLSTQTAVPTLDRKNIQNSMFVYTLDIEEQREIVIYLDRKLDEIETTIGVIEKQINSLKEYRQSLIYEAVTGKIDVRDMELD